MAKDPRPYVPESRDRTKLAPGFNRKIGLVIADMEAEGHDPILFEAVRVDRRQWWIYGCGRTVAECVKAGVAAVWAWATGSKVTNASSHLRSTHGHGMAADIISRSKRWNAPPAFWASLERACRKHGLTWGGWWKHPRDVPHCQWPLVRDGVTYAGPSARDRARTATEGMVATWRVYGADT